VLGVHRLVSPSMCAALTSLRLRGQQRRPTARCDQLCVLSPLAVEIDVCKKEHGIGGLRGGIHMEDLGVYGTEIGAATNEGGGGDVARLFGKASGSLTLVQRGALHRVRLR
jgi:hypothetical protein